MDFKQLVKGIHASRGIPGVPDSVLAFDPGHTTGWAYFKQLQWEESGEFDSKNMENATINVGRLIERTEPSVIIIEDYRIYRWKQKEHVGSDMLTTRVIGCMETHAIMFGIPLFKQSPQVAKQFCSDKKLKEWGFYVPGEKHARDAMRHATYFLIFGPTKKQDKDFYKDTTTNPV